MIIDGSSLLYRAFYALPLLSTKDGIYTNGVYGFLTMFYKIKDEYDLDYICIAFDKKGPTFRHIEFDKYKANRQQMPNELSIQFPILKEVLKAMNVTFIETDGYEADDIAGTVCNIGKENNMEVILVSGDKDYLQLVSPHSKVLLVRKGITQLEEYDEKKMEERYGITSQQFIDLKGLMGDQSDNIPGVPGIGEKTGIKLIKQFGSIENIFEHIDEVSGNKVKNSLIEYKQGAFMSRKLSEIITNVPLDIELEDLKVRKADFKQLKEIYEKLEFKSLINKIPEDEIEHNNKNIYRSEYFIGGKDNINTILKGIDKEKKFSFKFVFEDSDYIKDEILGVALKCNDFPSLYLDFLGEPSLIDEFKHNFKEYFERDDIEKIGHDLKGDILGLFRMGIDIKNITFDSAIAQYLINPSQTDYSIGKLSEKYLNVNIEDKEKILGKGKNKRTFKDLSVSERAEYFSNILNMVYSLENTMEGFIESFGMTELYNNVELPLIEVLASMEWYGFKVDENILKSLGEEFEEEIEKLTHKIFDLAGEEFNINSPKQLGEILFEKLNLPVIKKTKTGYSTDAEVLGKLKDKHSIVDNILKYRQLVKLKSTYIDGFIALIDKNTGRVHSSFNQTVTNTGRISSTEPNLQNIPVKTEEGKRIRKAFVPENNDYLLVDGDYSQIELRVLAHISDDPKLKESFFHDEDIHTRTASEVFKVKKEDVTPAMRGRAKAVNFGIIYGISDYGLSRNLNISRKEAKEYIKNYLENYSMVESYMDDIVKRGRETGYVETILHRRRYIPELNSKNFNVRSFGERIAMNTPIQGSAADIIKVAMVNVYYELKKRKLKSRLILQIHDELIVEAEKEEKDEVMKLLKDIMEKSTVLNVPLKADVKVGESWYETK
ncbi:DNA polymerase I [Acidilutibacter cellobiosedens]|jgi:DNA polymerase-1|uniref:DNA polymerase I n=1 Tax=Acidilutibacter cellobiosedens TaxID=2507161 RepID=A0A410QHL4_9FIRM|nr:DNA polymerase I [Acidilutibacter cellobiosedens]QAT63458.1 DNA polymerase I [Acidilutibacter cellobiosedens]